MVDPQKHQYSLLDLVTIINGTFEEIFSEFSFWCACETVKLKQIWQFAYLELIQYGENNKVVAKANARIFNAQVYNDFLQQTKLNSLQQLAGSTILFRGSFSFHPEHGFSIIIDELSAEYTLWQLQKKQEDILDQLKQMGIVHNNKKTSLWKPPFTLAIVSSETSAGREDFLSVIEQSSYAIKTIDYYSPMHGNSAQKGVHEALQNIWKDIKIGNAIDAVVILRGWGWSSGIIWQNDIDIAKGICYMPVPVVIAVGHTTDKFVLDDIAFLSAKTPTDAAYYFCKIYEEYETQIGQLYTGIQERIQDVVVYWKTIIPSLYENITVYVSTTYQKVLQDIQLWYQAIQASSPENILKYWYALVLKDGQYLDKIEADSLEKWDELEIKLFDKVLKVEIKEI